MNIGVQATILRTMKNILSPALARLASALALGGLFSQLVGCGGPTPATVDSGTPPVDPGTVVREDAFVARDAPMRDTNARVDSGIDTYDLQETAEDGLTNAFCVCSLFSAWSNMTECLPSMTPSVTSSPRCAGRQCMKM